MNNRRVVQKIRDEYSHPPCLNLSKIRNKSRTKLNSAENDNLFQKDVSPAGSNFSGSSETAVISFGCDKATEFSSGKKQNGYKGSGDYRVSTRKSQYSCSIQATSIEQEADRINQETQTDSPRKYSNNLIGKAFLITTILSIIFGLLVCSSTTGRGFLDTLKGLQDYFSRSDYIETSLIDSSRENKNLPELYLFREYMTELQEKVESLEKALVQLQQPEYIPRHKAADEMLENLYGTMPDYALESTGGSILGTPNTESYSTSGTISLFGFSLWKQITSHPRLIIQGLIQPGKCWTFKGTEGTAVIQLSQSIRVSSVTLEHFPEHLLPPGSQSFSAPKIFSLIAVPDCSNCKPVHLGLFEYNLFGAARQTFRVSKEKFESMPVAKIVEVHFSANHGNPVYTCVYRVRIHGQPDDSQV